jgi:hypothetical protein
MVSACSGQSWPVWRATATVKGSPAGIFSQPLDLPTAHIQQAMLRPQSLLVEELELQKADFFPQSADDFSMVGYSGFVLL